MTYTPNPKQGSTAKYRSQLPPSKEEKALNIATTPQLRRSSRLIRNTPAPPTSTSPSTAVSSLPQVDESETYAGIMTAILDATDSYLGLGPITTELGVHIKLREWIEGMSMLASPSELKRVLQDISKYIDTVLAGLGKVTDVESENNLWELELRKMGYTQTKDGNLDRLVDGEAEGMKRYVEDTGATSCKKSV